MSKVIDDLAAKFLEARGESGESERRLIERLHVSRDAARAFEEGTASAVRLNDHYALTSAHTAFGLEGYDVTYEVGTGANFRTDRGTVVPVARLLNYPAFDGGVGTTPDL